VRRDRKGKWEYVHTLQNAKGECYGADYMVNGAFVEVFDDYDSFYEQTDDRQYHGLLKGVQYAFVTTGSVDFITDDEKVCVLWFQQRRGRPFTSKKDEPIVAFPMKGLLEDETDINAFSMIGPFIMSGQSEISDGKPARDFRELLNLDMPEWGTKKVGIVPGGAESFDFKNNLAVANLAVAWKAMRLPLTWEREGSEWIDGQEFLKGYKANPLNFRKFLEHAFRMELGRVYERSPSTAWTNDQAFRRIMVSTRLSNNRV